MARPMLPALIRIAHTHPETRRYLVPVIRQAIRTAMEFPTQDALDAYLKEHPKADKSNHTVKKEAPSESSDEPQALIEDVHSFLGKVKARGKSFWHAMKKIKDAPAATQKFFTDGPHRKKVMQDAAVKAKDLWKHSSHRVHAVVQKYINEHKEVPGIIKKLHTDEKLTYHEKRVLFETTLEVTSTIMGGFLGGPIKSVVSWGAGTVIDWGAEALEETMGEYQTVRDTHDLGRLVHKGLKMIRKLGAEKKDPDPIEVFTTVVMDKLVTRLDKGMSDEELLKAVTQSDEDIDQRIKDL